MVNKRVNTNFTAATVVCYLLACTLPMLIVLFSFWRLNVYPFGDMTISYWDMRNTYTYFLEWFKNVLEGNGSLFYSFSKSLGGNMFAGYTTLCASPLDLLAVFSPGKNPMPFVTLVVVLKFGLSGITSLYYLRHRFEIGNVFSLALSLCYSLMLFMTTEYSNLLWTDAVILLPLVMLGVYRLVSSGRTVLLFFTLLLGILIDWYNGYMACLFVILLYLLESYIVAPRAREDDRPVCLKNMVYLNRFAITFVLAILASLVFLLPTALELMGGKGGDSVDLFKPGLRYFPLEIFRSVLFGIHEQEHLPQIYTGMFALVCALLFLLCKKVPRRERIATFVLFAFLVISTCYAPLDRIWCGLRDGTSFYCRFSYLISAVMIFMAARFLECSGAETFANKKAMFIVAGAIIVIAAITWVGKMYPSDLLFVIACALTVIYVAVLAVWDKLNSPGWRAVLSTALIVLTCGELVLTTYDSVLFCLPRDDRSGFDRYESYFGEGEEQFAEIDEMDGTNVNDYRVTKLYTFLTGEDSVMSNEGFVYGYSQIAQYDSCFDARVRKMMSSMGYSSEWICMTTYYNPVLPSDSLLGVRYVSAPECPPGFVDVQTEKTQDGNRFYENPYAMPLGFISDSSIIQSEIPTCEDTDLNKNPFEYQNEVFKLLTGINKDCYKKVEVSSVSTTQEEKAWQTAISDGQIVYGYFACNPNAELRALAEDGTEITTIDKWSHGVFPLSSKIGTGSQRITLCAQDSSVAPYDFENNDINMLVYELDMDVFQEIYDRVMCFPLTIEVFDDGFVRGEVISPEDGILLTTIPYDRGWSIKVNGNAVDAAAAQGVFTAIPVSQGKNTIEMSYIPPGLIPGALVTLLSLLIYFVCLFIWTRRRS